MRLAPAATHARCSWLSAPRPDGRPSSLCVRPRPLWLSPAQVMVIPVGGDSESYSKQVSGVPAGFAEHVLHFCFLSGCDGFVFDSA